MADDEAADLKAGLLQAIENRRAARENEDAADGVELDDDLDREEETRATAPERDREDHEIKSPEASGPAPELAERGRRLQLTDAQIEALGEDGISVLEQRLAMMASTVQAGAGGKEPPAAPPAPEPSPSAKLLKQLEEKVASMKEDGFADDDELAFYELQLEYMRELGRGQEQSSQALQLQAEQAGQTTWDGLLKSEAAKPYEEFLKTQDGQDKVLDMIAALKTGLESTGQDLPELPVLFQQALLLASGPPPTKGASSEKLRKRASQVRPPATGRESNTPLGQDEARSRATSSLEQIMRTRKMGIYA